METAADYLVGHSNVDGASCFVWEEQRALSQQTEQDAPSTKKMKNRIKIENRLKSFGYAFRGIGTMLRSQQNAWIHAVATVVVILAGFVFGLSRIEWCLIVLAIVSVWTAEALNTAFEFLCDVASPEYHPLVEKAKDVAAGAVLVCAVGAAVIGLLVFVPRILL